MAFGLSIITHCTSEMLPVNRELNKLRKLMKVTKKGIKFLLLSNGEKLQKEEQEKLNKILVEQALVQPD